MDNLIIMSAIIEKNEKAIKILIYCMQMQKNPLRNLAYRWFDRYRNNKIIYSKNDIKMLH